MGLHGDNHDLTAAYHRGFSAAEIYGPSGVGNAIKPGTLTGILIPIRSEQPSVQCLERHTSADYWISVESGWIRRTLGKLLDGNTL